MNKKFVLIACECSQIECSAFRRHGAIAFSCDIQPCYGGHPEWHIQDDVTKYLQSGGVFRTQDGKRHTVKQWDLIVSHPPCTYLTKASAVRLFAGRQLNQERYKKGIAARAFWQLCYDANAEHIAVENPTPLTIFKLPRPQMVIQPYEYGMPYSKRTCYWLRNLPPLMPTLHAVRYTSWTMRTSNPNVRSKSFENIAEQMAVQWLPLI